MFARDAGGKNATRDFIVSIIWSWRKMEISPFIQDFLCGVETVGGDEAKTGKFAVAVIDGWQH